MVRPSRRLLVIVIVAQSILFTGTIWMYSTGSDRWAQNYFQCAKISKGWEKLAMDRGDKLYGRRDD